MKALHTKRRISHVKNTDFKGPQELNEAQEVEIDVTMESHDPLSFDLPALDVEVDTEKEANMNDILCGRRTVSLAHILDQDKNIVLHKYKCTIGDMKFQREIRNGLFTALEFYCVNSERRSGCLSSGIGHSQCEEIFGLINGPMMTAKAFARKTSLLKKTWEDHLTVKMRESGKEEQRIALQKGHVTTTGVPYIAVAGDGGWSKRSYGHGYNASSGVGIIIGVETKMPLILGVRNKVCSLCNFYQKNKQEPRKHECAMNFKGPSTSMEQDIIVEGFKSSIDQHGMIYKYYIGIYLNPHYLLCAYHMIRGLNDKLHKISSNTQYPLGLRKLLTSRIDGISRIERLVKGIRTAIKLESENGSETSVLRHDIANAVNHVFGRHTNCRNTFCKNEDEEDLVLKLENSPIHEAIMKSIDPLVQKVDRIVFNQTTNYAERYMTLVAKCVEGKRINFTGRLSYTARAQAAGLAHSSGPGWHLTSCKYHTKKDPGKIMTTVFARRSKGKKMSHKRRKVRAANNEPDENYGPETTKPDMTRAEFSDASEKFLDTLKDRVINNEKRDEVEINTRGQHENQLWRELRRNYLNASNFGVVIKRRKTSPCHNLLKNMLYRRDVNTAAIVYGRMHEDEAIQKYCIQRNVQIHKCGLFISTIYPYLGTSPDGSINGEDGIIEVKCLPGIGNRKFREAASGKTCFELVNNKIVLKRQHNFFFQIQGQLCITEKSFCDLILFSKNDFHVERIFKDEALWSEKMVPKLVPFYLNCMLPEIVDPRLPRGMKIRDYVISTQ